MEVCPAHEYHFIGLERRVAQLVDHNRQRSAEVLRVLDEHRPETVWDIARHLTWSRGWESLQAFSLRLAVSETASTCCHSATKSVCPSRNQARLRFGDGNLPGTGYANPHGRCPSQRTTRGCSSLPQHRPISIFLIPMPAAISLDVAL
jgi:hypothetical protein